MSQVVTQILPLANLMLFLKNDIIIEEKVFN